MQAYSQDLIFAGHMLVGNDRMLGPGLLPGVYAIARVYEVFLNFCTPKDVRTCP